MKSRFLKASTVRKHVRLVYGKRMSKEFLLALDLFIERKLQQACHQHNGGKKTLDASLAAYIIG